MTDAIAAVATSTMEAAPTPILLPHKFIPLGGFKQLRILIVGTGGNGGYLLPPVARMLWGLSPGHQDHIMVHCKDPDIVESKNINRQNFITGDIGKNKAQVLTERYGDAFNLPDKSLTFIPEALTAPDQISKIVGSSETSMIVIVDCVDKTTPRSVIHSYFKQPRYHKHQIFLISCGNAEWTGQVALGANVASGAYSYSRLKPEPPGRFTITSKPYPFSIPLPYDLYPTLVDVELDKQEEALSCAERAGQNIQYQATNIIVASLAFNYLNVIVSNFFALLDGKPERLIPINTGTVYFDARTNAIRTEYLTDGYLNPVVPSKEVK